eukprot:scaffold143861_cov22-Prasinocladus_malaysianus.AAC.1
MFCAPQPEVAESAQPAAAAPEPSPEIVSQLMSMGFSKNGSKRAALATGNSSAEASMEWVFAHMEVRSILDRSTLCHSSVLHAPSICIH